MSANYVADTPISRPVKVRNVTADVDLNGVQFSYDWGLFYDSTFEDAQIRLPDF